MGLMDRLTAGFERAAQEADKAFDKGKTKVGELQIEVQMDGLAKKLGYIVFDFYRGREIDQAARQKYLDDMAALEDRLLQSRAEAAAKKEAEAAARAQRAAGAPAGAGPAAGPAPDAPPQGTDTAEGPVPPAAG